MFSPYERNTVSTTFQKRFEKPKYSLSYRGKGNQDYILNVTFLTLYARVEYKEFNNQSLYDSSINCVHTWVLECM